MDRYGRLDRDIFHQGVVAPPQPEDLDRALWRFAGGAVLPHRRRRRWMVGTPPSVLTANAWPALTIAGSCLAIEGSAALTLDVADRVSIKGVGEWTIGLARWALPQPVDAPDDHSGRLVCRAISRIWVMALPTGSHSSHRPPATYAFVRADQHAW